MRVFFRVGALECELKMLKTSANLLESESKRKDDVLQQSTAAMCMMEEEHTKLRKVRHRISTCSSVIG